MVSTKNETARKTQEQTGEHWLIGLADRGYEDVDWICLAPEWAQWWGLVSMVPQISVPLKVEIFPTFLCYKLLMEFPLCVASYGYPNPHRGILMNNTITVINCNNNNNNNNNNKNITCNVVSVAKLTVLVRMIGFICTLVTVSLSHIYNRDIADLHNLQSLHTNFLSLFPLVFSIRFLATNL
jgi:hypothetical protein